MSTHHEATPQPAQRPALDERIKYIAWTVGFVSLVVAGTCIAIFADADDQVWVKDIVLVLIGMAIPGSPLGALFARKTSTPPV